MPKPRGRGRPTAYDPAYCDRVIAHMRGGQSYESFAGEIGVCVATLYTWEKKHRDFLEAKKVAQAACLNFWEKIGIMGVTGAVKKDAHGNVVIDGKKVNGTLWIYNMKCRFPKQWREQIEIKTDDKTTPMLAYARNRKEKPSAKK